MLLTKFINRTHKNKDLCPVMLNTEGKWMRMQDFVSVQQILPGWYFMINSFSFAPFSPFFCLSELILRAVNLRTATNKGPGQSRASDSESLEFPVKLSVRLTCPCSVSVIRVMMFTCRSSR